MSRALVEAAQNGNVERIGQLLDRGVAIDSPQPGGWTALMAAAAHARTAAVDLLVARGADLKAIDDSGNTPLHHAVCGGKQAIVRALVARGADLNARTRYGCTPLHLAVQEGRLGIIRLLVQAGADVSAQTTDELTPLKQGFKNPRIRALLEAAGARLDPALEATVAKVVARAAAFRARGETPEFRQKARSALVDAAFYGQVELVRSLLAAGLPVDVVHAQSKMTPLQAAASAGAAATFQMLLDAGADLARADISQWPIMVLAAYGGSAAIVGLLAARGVDANQTGSDGITPLMAAALQGHADVTRVLLEAGADPHRRGGSMFARRGKTALEIAQDNRKKTVIPLLAAASGLAPEAVEDPAYAACRRFGEMAATPAFQQVLERLAVICGRPPVPWKKRRGVFLCNLRGATPARIAALQTEVRAAGFHLVDAGPGTGDVAKLMVFPTPDKFAVIVARGSNGINEGLTTRAIVAWLRELDRENRFELIGCGFDFIDGAFCAPVVNAQSWAQRMLEFCPDCESTSAILQGFGRGGFSLWWD